MKQLFVLISCLVLGVNVFGQSGGGTASNYFQLGVHNLADPYTGNQGTPPSYIGYQSGELLHRTPQDAYQHSLCQGTRLGLERKANTNDKPIFLMIISYVANPAPYLKGPSQSNPDWTILGYGQEAYLDLTTDQDFYVGFTVDAGYATNGYVASGNDIWYVKFNVAKGITLNAPSICLGQTANVSASGCGLQLAQNGWDPAYPSLLTYWSTGAIGVGQIIVSPKVTTNYTLQTKCWVYSHIPNVGFTPTVYLLTTSYQTTVTVQTPIPPSVIGENTRCNSNNTYTIGNYQANQTYTVSATHSTGAITVNSIGQFTVNWNATFPNPGVATITVNSNTSLGCAVSTSFEVASCCIGSQSGDLLPPIFFVNATSTQILQTLQTTSLSNINRQIVLNGVTTIEQNLTITN